MAIFMTSSVLVLLITSRRIFSAGSGSTQAFEASNVRSGKLLQELLLIHLVHPNLDGFPASYLLNPVSQPSSLEPFELLSSSKILM